MTVQPDVAAPGKRRGRSPLAVTARRALGVALSPDTPDDVLAVLAELSEADFSEPWHRAVWWGWRRVRGTGERPDIVNVTAALRHHPDGVPAAYVGSLTDGVAEADQTRRSALRLVKRLTSDRRTEEPGRAEFLDTHMANGRRLAARWGENWLYCAARAPRGWYQWTGARWEVDDTAAVKRLAYEALPKVIVAEAAAGVDGRSRDLLAWAQKSENRDVVSGGLDAFSVLIPVHPDEFDRDPWLFSCANVTLDLRTGQALEPRRADRLTRGSLVAWDPDAACPRWERCLAEWHPGQEDVVAFLRRAVGLSLIGATLEKAFLFLHGPESDNGKSAFVEAVRRVFGSYAVHVETATLLESKYGQSSGSPRADLLALRGARLATVQETKEGGRLSDDQLKWITGGDRMAARRPHAVEMEEWDPSHTLWISGNYEPQLSQGSKVFNRLLKVPWLQSFHKGDPRRDPRLGEALAAEGPGILRWCVLGVREFLDRGLDPPALVLSATKQMERSQDDLGRFLEERCLADKTKFVNAVTLREAFEAWASAKVSQKRFGQWMRDRGFDSFRGTGGRTFYQGVDLAAEAAPLDPPPSEPREYDREF